MGKLLRGYGTGCRTLPRRGVSPADLFGPILFGMTSSTWPSARLSTQQTFSRLSSQQRCSAAILGWLMGAVLLGCGNASADETPAVADTDGAMRIRIVEIPEKEKRNAPVGELTYRPMKRTKFERLMREIHEHATSPAGTLVRIDRATYFAQLDNGQLVNGIGRWDIDQGAERPITLSLDNFQLPLLQPRWDGADENPITGHEDM